MPLRITSGGSSLFSKESYKKASSHEFVVKKKKNKKY